MQKLLSIAIPSYNSQDYLSHAVESLLPGGEEVEILIVNDGSKDRTAEIADEYERKYPGICRAVHKENGGHGDAVMTGLRAATGTFFKVVDSDDWVDAEAYPEVLETLRMLRDGPETVDLVISNYIYDKVGQEHKKVMQYRHALPENRVFTWDDAHFHVSQYMLMHSVIYRTELLRTCGMELPKHTFYVDELYVYVPLRMVRNMYYLNVDFYHYFIGREDQSVQESIMIRRIDQALTVNRLMVSSLDIREIKNRRQRAYMRNYLEIVTTVSSVLLTKAGTEEHMRKRKELWEFIRKENPWLYRHLRWRPMGFAIHLPGRLGKKFLLDIYGATQKIYGFN
ncbi:MAG: glycosyltransferase family 2 protein [Clostridia bacterium]|nr:glycosyltransferase family 2 protein [Clostridia bacterium]